MVHYSRKGFKISYPDFMKKKSDFPYSFRLQNTLDKPPLNTLFFVSLLPSGLSFKEEAERYNESYWEKNINPRGKTLLRIGEYSVYPGAKEELVKEVYPNGSIHHHWSLLLPVGQRILEVRLLITADDLKDINDIWKPIIDSMEFDEFVIDQIPDEKLPEKKLNWTKVTDEKPKRNKIMMPIENNLAGLWDSGTEFYDEDGDLEEAIDSDSVSRRYIKSAGKLILFSVCDPLEVAVELYYKAEAPELSKWAHVIEGLIETSSGTLCVGSGEPFIKIKMNKGVYSFKVYFGIKNQDSDDGAEEFWRIYFWPTEQPETDEVNILKSCD